METQKTSVLSRVLLLLAGGLLLAALAFPMWQIQLEAPQYPEGLVLKLYPNKIGGDVEIINGLNHYIGMKTLHTENFPEFGILPYIIGLFGVMSILIAALPNRKRITGIFIAFLVFATVSAIDFYRWNYQYGHDLDPNAAIQVPGMAYQPPLLGYKQLLNFAAYSVPDTGGWLMIGAAVLIFIAVIKETGLLKRFSRRNIGAAAASVLLLGLMSCSPRGPEPIKLNSDNCDFCKMTISNGRFAAQTITKKGRIYKFDDVSCMMRYVAEFHNQEYAGHYVSDYLQDNTLIPADKAFYLRGGTINSPMRGNVAAFSSLADADAHQPKLGAAPLTWHQLSSVFK